jgi:hypothetical protein
VNLQPLRIRTLTFVACLAVASCAAKKDHPSAAAPAEPSADPSSRVNRYTAERPDRNQGPELGKGDAPSLVQPVNDCDLSLCTGGASEALIEAVRSRAAQARSCYEKSLSKTPTLGGRMLLNLRVAHDGSSCPFGIAQNELADSPTLVPCLRALLQTQYPKPVNGCVELNLPLRFVPEYVDAGATGS